MSPSVFLLPFLFAPQNNTFFARTLFFRFRKQSEEPAGNRKGSRLRPSARRSARRHVCCAASIRPPGARRSAACVLELNREHWRRILRTGAFLGVSPSPRDAPSRVRRRQMRQAALLGDRWHPRRSFFRHGKLIRADKATVWSCQCCARVTENK